MVAEAVVATEFCRDWRNRRIAHRDLKLTLQESSEPLAEGSRARVNEGLRSVGAVRNAVARRYLDAAAPGPTRAVELFSLQGGSPMQPLVQPHIKSVK